MFNTLKKFFFLFVYKLQKLFPGISMPTYKTLLFLLSVMSNFFFLLRIQKLTLYVEKLTLDNQHLEERTEVLNNKVNALAEKIAKEKIDSQELVNSAVSDDKSIFSVVYSWVFNNSDILLGGAVVLAAIYFLYFYNQDTSFLFRDSDSSNSDNSPDVCLSTPVSPDISPKINTSPEYRSELIENLLSTWLAEGRFPQGSLDSAESREIVIQHVLEILFTDTYFLSHKYADTIAEFRKSLLGTSQPIDLEDFREMLKKRDQT